MKIMFQTKCGIPNPLPTVNLEGPFIFHVKRGIPAVYFMVTIDPSGQNIVSVSTFEASSELYTALCKKLERNAINDDVYNEYLSVSRGLHDATMHVFNLLKQELYLYDHRWLTGNPLEWSLEGNDWNIIPWGSIFMYTRQRQEQELDRKSATDLQILLNRGEEALLATEHLLEAERTKGRKFQWIEATVAAELAIKEILVRIEPKLEAILLNLPSPPIHKLYGNIFENITGERSEYVAVIKKGAEIRNDFIHKPKHKEINYQEVYDYIANIRKAIKHISIIERKINRTTMEGT